MPVYILRYKSSRSSSVQFANFDAENPARADAAVHTWCNREPGRQFVGLTPFLTGTAAELLGPMPTTAQAATPSPSPVAATQAAAEKKEGSQAPGSMKAAASTR